MARGETLTTRATPWAQRSSWSSVDALREHTTRSGATERIRAASRFVKAASWEEYRKGWREGRKAESGERRGMRRGGWPTSASSGPGGRLRQPGQGPVQEDGNTLLVVCPHLRVPRALHVADGRSLVQGCLGGRGPHALSVRLHGRPGLPRAG